MSIKNHFDYIIVGAGSAGCVLANRLSDGTDCKVLLLEAGPRDRSLYIHMPAAFNRLYTNNRYNWQYESEAEPFMNGRQFYCPRGKTLGGSSSINGMSYVRGHPSDYNRWAEMGLSSWSYEHVLPYFKRAESWEKGPDSYRGGEGPMHISAGDESQVLSQAFIKAGIQAGIPYTADVNGFQQEGVGAFDRNIYKGKRWSTAAGHLRPARKRPNLRIETGAFTSKICLEGKRARSVEYRQSGRLYHAYADREIILAAGSVDSPKLLMLSGIGPVEHLTKLDIPVVKNVPNVGENLQDHLEVVVQYACTQPITLFSLLKPHRQAIAGMQWFLFKTGGAASSHFDVGAFLRSSPDLQQPDVQLHFLAMATSDDWKNISQLHGFQCHFLPLQPTSRGRVRLRSNDPGIPPTIELNYQQTTDDRQAARRALHLTRNIFSQKAFDKYRGPEIKPGKAIQSDSEIDAFIRADSQSAYHLSCTCAMGMDDEAVVDSELKVRGIDGLRVVDASVMPKIVSGNTNAVTIMIAEKAADLILSKEPLEPQQVPVYTPHS